MAAINKFEEQEIWQLARIFSTDIYKISKYPDFSLDFKSVGQIRGSSGSVTDNIAEVFEREGNKEFRQFLSISKGSCGECRSQLIRALDRNYISEPEFKTIYNKLIDESIKIKNFMSYLKKVILKEININDRGFEEVRPLDSFGESLKDSNKFECSQPILNISNNFQTMNKP
jgi:four helix bundle protein